MSPFIIYNIQSFLNYFIIFRSLKTCEVSKNYMITLLITVKGQNKYFHGFGTSKKLAKCAAAKQALRYLNFKQ
jgi:dsRNA-specific ribonuclease